MARTIPLSYKLKFSGKDGAAPFLLGCKIGS
jgi:hypothetical protein